MGSQGVARAAATGAPEPNLKLGRLLKTGLLLNEASLDTQTELNTLVTIVDLPTPGQPIEYLLGLRNFYVLTRYNKSFFYAAAVHQLSQHIKQRMGHGIAQNS